MKKKNMLMAALMMGVASMISCTSSTHEQTLEGYLEKVLANTEKIKVAEYEITSKTKAPYEKGWTLTSEAKIIEHDNPKDTTIGASEVKHNNLGVSSIYDGTNYVHINHKEKSVTIKDFQDKQSKALPFRTYGPPFFNYVKSLMRYMLTTTDSIQLVREETEEDYIYKLSIYENQQVEFFGRDYRIPSTSLFFSEEDAYSFYTLWIRKADNMPYRYLREMSHNVQDITCNLISWSDQPAKEPIVATDYIPDKGYEVHYAGRSEQKKKDASVDELLVGKAAPEWTLKDMDGKEIPKMYTFHNVENGWYLLLDVSTEVAQRIAVERDGNSLRFYIWEEEAKPLFTLNAYTGNDRNQAAQANNQFVLYQTNSVVYAAKLEVQSAAYGITQESLTGAFRLMGMDLKKEG